MKEIYALIIEDHVDSAEMVGRILTFYSRSYATAMSAEDALVQLEEYVPKIIVLDLALPIVNGWELLRIIRRTPLIANVPVVAITAHHSSRVAQDTIEAGFNAYFTKPLDTTSFVRELDRAIEATKQDIKEQ